MQKKKKNEKNERLKKTDQKLETKGKYQSNKNRKSKMKNHCLLFHHFPLGLLEGPPLRCGGLQLPSPLHLSPQPHRHAKPHGAMLPSGRLCPCNLWFHALPAPLTTYHPSACAAATSAGAPPALPWPPDRVRVSGDFTPQP